MKKVALILFCSILLGSGEIYCQHAEAGKVNKEAQNAWLRKTKHDLERALADSGLPVIQPAIAQIPDYQAVVYRIQGRGIIQFNDGKRLLLQSHSSHENEEIGDITLGLSSDGETYYNLGHVCGGIIHFQSQDTLLPKSAQDFFIRFLSDTDDKKWDRLK